MTTSLSEGDSLGLGHCPISPKGSSRTQRAFSFKKTLLVTLPLFLLSSCAAARKIAQIKEERRLRKSMASLKEHEIEAHLIHLGEDFIKSKNTRFIRPSQKGRRYLKGVVKQILRSNPSLYPKEEVEGVEIKFYFIKNDTPFYFSLPGGSYFYSTGIIKKYLKSESLLQALIALQTFRIFKKIYTKGTLVPKGFITVEELISLTRVPLRYKNEINKWAYLTLKRAKFDPFSILNWIQVRNKNTFDFTLIDGNVSAVAREEFLIKRFLTKKREPFPAGLSKKNSSKKFYHLIKDINRKSL